MTKARDLSEYPNEGATLDGTETLTNKTLTTPTIAGGTVTAAITFGNYDYIHLGDSIDFSAHSTGTNTHLTNKNGILFIDATVNSGLTKCRSNNSVGVLKETLVLGGTTPLVELYYDGVKTLETTVNGVTITGSVSSTQNYISPSNPPASASDTGTAGMYAWNATHFYVCIATNTWVRVALATW